MNNRTIGLLAVLALLALLAYFTIGKRDVKRTTKAEETQFALTDTAGLTKIVLTKKQNGKEVKQILMEKTSEGWSLNKNSKVAMPQLHLFFKTVAAIKVRSTLNEQTQKSLDKVLEESHVLVEYYKGNDLVKAYQVGMEGKAHLGSYLRMVGSDNGYVVEIPGFQGNLNGYYATDIEAWRENLLFDGDLSKIKKIEVAFSNKNKTSFSLSRENATTPWMLNDKSADTTKLRPYLSNFKGKIYFETVAHADFPGKFQELQKQKPDVVYQILYLDGKMRKVNLFLRPDSWENYFAYIEGKDLLLTVQHFVVDKFLTTDNPYLLWKDEMSAAKVGSK